MSKVIEEMRIQTMKEVMIDVVDRMLAYDVLAYEKIAEYIGLLVNEVENLKEDMII